MLKLEAMTVLTLKIKLQLKKKINERIMYD